ncbi:hypothetical protein LGK99_13695 [Clostridium algidicarnis]|uniref:hypothetical protein n=1 Tax=Clostridium algidicarnis TaxID=37659 RepID=UPI001628CCDC|nr:hypothetical protein [Clostridium algidicarnis]MBB6632396.1 hypothetical protein [Clostridium algidicarnis]MCB2288107.1 hypothetical protein [Clostridium algidicarnis]
MYTKLDRVAEIARDKPCSLQYFERSISDKVYVSITIINLSLVPIILFDLLAAPPVALDFQVANVDLLMPVSIESRLVEIFSGGNILRTKDSFSSYDNYLTT